VNAATLDDRIAIARCGLSGGISRSLLQLLTTLEGDAKTSTIFKYAKISGVRYAARLEARFSLLSVSK